MIASRFSGSRSRKARGFTLVELLVVIAIIGVLVALLLPAIQAAREAARRTQCSNNLKQISLGLNNYHDTFKTFPPGAWNEANRGNRLAWTVFILPFIEQQTVYQEFNFEYPNYTGVNLLPGIILVPTYHCPSLRLKTGDYSGEFVGGKAPYTTHYYAVMGPQGINPLIPGGTTRYPESDNVNPHGGYAYGGVLYRNSSTRIGDITDGTSNTVMVGELAWDAANCYRTWLRGANGTAVGSAKNIEFGLKVAPYASAGWTNNFNDVSFGSEHPAGCHFAVCDGSVAFVAENIEMNVLLAIASREGAEPQTAIRR